MLLLVCFISVFFCNKTRAGRPGAGGVGDADVRRLAWPSKRKTKSSKRRDGYGGKTLMANRQSGKQKTAETDGTTILVYPSLP